MRIYTRTGDDGTTGLFGGARTSKSDPRVDAYGTFDEANAAIGLARAAGVPPALDGVLAAVQDDVFTLCAELACAPGAEAKLTITLLAKDQVEWLEHAIDAADAELPPLREFIIPGGTQASAALHLARCIVRRGERILVSIAAAFAIRPELVMYANRLSDLLFVLARRANQLAGTNDVEWHSAHLKRKSTDGY
jgi:cob(I)alamin adenosyltransferase